VAGRHRCGAAKNCQCSVSPRTNHSRSPKGSVPESNSNGAGTFIKKVWYILLQFSKRNTKKQTNKQTKPYLKEFRYVVLQVFGYRRQEYGGGPAHDVTKCQERAASACGILLTIAQLITN